MFISLPTYCWPFTPWCAEDTYYYTDPDAEAILEDPQLGEEDEVREWGVDDVV